MDPLLIDDHGLVIVQNGSCDEIAAEIAKEREIYHQPGKSDYLRHNGTRKPR